MLQQKMFCCVKATSFNKSNTQSEFCLFRHLHTAIGETPFSILISLAKKHFYVFCGINGPTEVCQLLLTGP